MNWEQNPTLDNDKKTQPNYNITCKPIHTRKMGRHDSKMFEGFRMKCKFTQFFRS